MHFPTEKYTQFSKSETTFKVQHEHPRDEVWRFRGWQWGDLQDGPVIKSVYHADSYPSSSSSPSIWNQGSSLVTRYIGNSKQLA